MKTCIRWGSHFALVLTLTCTAVQAQELAGTFDQLRVLVKSGDTLTITDSSGGRLRGKLADLSDTSLLLEVSGARRLFQAAEVSTIEKRGADSLKNGALIGLAIGGGLFGTALGVVTGELGYVVTGAFVYGGIGAGIGAGVDALIERPRIIYAARSTRATFNIAPIASRSHQGVALSIDWGR
jgi:hypothetical protein